MLVAGNTTNQQPATSNQQQETRNEKDKNNIGKKPDRQARAAEINVKGLGAKQASCY